MSIPRSQLRLVMLQVRSKIEPLLHEQRCFIEKCGVQRKRTTFINLVDNPDIRWRHVENAHGVIIGGAGGFSVTDHHPFTDPLREIIWRLIDEGRPLFGSCWGHQFLAASLGGRVVIDFDRSEVGSHTVELTSSGTRDPLFEGLSPRFTGQFGHNDRVVDLGPDLEELAYSKLCPNQVIRVRDKPVYGTQFHSELDAESLRTRLMDYAKAYAPDPGVLARILDSLKPSAEAALLLPRFLDLYA